MPRKYTVSATFSEASVSFDDIQTLHSEFVTLLDFAKGIRAYSTTLLLDGYNKIKAAKGLFDHLVRCRYNAEKVGKAIVFAIKKLNLLYHWLAENPLDDVPNDRVLRGKLDRLLAKLNALLPVDGGVQLALFDDAAYETDERRLPYTSRFSLWLSQQHRWSQTRRSLVSLTPLPFKQLSLSLRAATDW